MRRKYLYPLFIIILFAFISCNNEDILHEVNIIPIPTEISVIPGDFEITGKTQVLYSDDKKVKRIADFIIDEAAKFNIELQSESINNNKSNKNSIILELNEAIEMDKEAYSMTINKSGVHMMASDPAGLFYAFQSLKQMFPIEKSKKIILPFLEINDKPRFKWRGMHLDVCRHFMPKEYIKTYIDHLSLMKMNTFHWHLTEDQGWRIEIKAFPKLTEIGSWREETVIGHAKDRPVKYDGIKHGGFYTQEDIKEIVQYANDRFITIVPEIEMPGHAQAAIASYPFLGCTGEKIDVWTTWGVSPYIYNVEDTTFKFLETVLDEVISLFPGEYVHIGGDEAIKDQWRSSKDIQKKIKELGLKNEHELQSYFIKRIETFVNSKGRTIIGWDEILEGGLAPNAVVMSWRGTEGGIEAARSGHYVVMSPGTHCYFDHYQSQDTDNEPLAIGGFTDIEKVYRFEPIPDELSDDEKKYILGAQANVWTEYILDPDHVNYMIFPRMIALAEVLWSPPEKKEYQDFLKRLKSFKTYLDSEGIKYGKHIFDETGKDD